LSDLLVDSSVWVEFFRGNERVVTRLDAALEADRVAVCGPVVAEILSGARSRREFETLRSAFEGVDLLPDPPESWSRIAETRFALARRGTQAALVDLLIALTAAEAGHTLLTRDSDFERIAAVLPVDLARV
jgi:predicted nucleic acid-binding protein